MGPPRAAPRRTSAKGRHRRQLLLAAAAELLTEQGFAAVSHRAVARHADLPLAATTYYFASLDELLTGAVQHLADAWLAASREVVSGLPEQLRDPRRLAEAVIKVAAPEATNTGAGRPAGLLTLYDRYLVAARHPNLRPAIVGYDAHVDTLLMDVLRRGGLDALPADARMVLAVVDGALLRTLGEGAPAASAVPTVERLLHVLMPTM